MKPVISFIIIIVVTVIIFFASCNNQQPTSIGKDSLKGRVSISGAFALYPLAVKWSEEFMKLHPNVHMDISAGGAGKGITDALAGMVDLGMVSRPINQEEINKGAWFIAVTKDAVLPIVNAKNPMIQEILSKGLTKTQFSGIYITGEINDWGICLNNKQRGKINVYTRSDACGAAEMWGKYLGKNQESLKGIGVFGDPGIGDAIKKDIYGIGYNNVIYVYDIHSRQKYEGIEIVPIDLNENGIIDKNERFYGNLDEIGKAIGNGTYPSPPARDLYFVSKGPPVNKVASEFIRWALTEGQKYVVQAGYVELSKDKTVEELKKLK
jgi:phosphate transport system substrate-binding protein